MNKRLLSVILVLSVIIGLFSGININAEPINAMPAIEDAFSSYKQGNTFCLDDDGYADMPVDVYVYYDSSKGVAKPGLGGTFVIVYAVNTNTERIGRDTDVNIITSMLDRGYIVVVADYKNNPASSTPTIDWSVHKIRERTQKMEFFTDTKIFPKGSYCENIAVPAGYDVSLKKPFWSIDEHGTKGSLEKIVEVWNTDFKSIRGELFVKWVDDSGNKKPTDKGAVWYNADKTTVNSAGEYTKIKYTKARDIHDIVNPDGTPVDLNQYINIAYPTNPLNPVPVMTMASSGTGNLSALFGASFRPQMNGFLFRGYAGAIFDYAYIPMARDDVYQFFDGSTANGKTKDALIYSLAVYNDKLVNTAAMRYLRYLAMSNPTEYNFDINSFGAYGNSKGSWINYLASAKCREKTDIGDYDNLDEAINERLCSLPMKRIHAGYEGTRYQNGNREDEGTIRGGKMQPYLTYNGKEISSAIQFVYTSCGGAEEDILPGGAPMFLSSNFGDELGSPYNTTYRLLSACKAMDIPTLHLDVATNHSFCNGNDLNYGVDSYTAFMDYAGYYLKKDPIKVVYTEPMDGTSDIKPGDSILIKFGGDVSETEISKISITDDTEGEPLTGSWTSEFGNTEWSFTPNNLKEGTSYTVNIPADFCGENKVSMGKPYSFGFKTKNEQRISPSYTEGTHFEYTVPDLSKSSYLNTAKLRLSVKNDAANTALVYLTDSLESENGDLLGKINLKGSGVYEINVSDIALGKAPGEKLYFYIAAENQAETKVVYSDEFIDNNGKNYKSSFAAESLETAPDGKTPSYKLAIRAVKDDGETSYYKNESPYYSNTTTLFTNSLLLNNGVAFNDNDYGRKFNISFKVYDTKSRAVFMSFSDNTSKFESFKINSAIEKSVVDRDSVSYAASTSPHQWTDVSFDYVVYDKEYGKFANAGKILTVTGTPDGDDLTPYYFANLKVTEVITDISLAENNGAELVYTAEGNKNYVENSSPKAFADASGNGYSTYKEAVSASGYVKLLQNHVLTNDELADISSYTDFTLDLNGYRIYCENTEAALIWAKSLNNKKTNITVKNGTIILKDTPLVSYKDSTSGGSYSINLENVDILTEEFTSVTSYISEKASSAAISSSFVLRNCNIEVPDRNLTKNKSVIFAKGEDSLNLSYEIHGGTIKLTTERKVSVADNLKYTTFYKDNGSYTKLLITSPYFVPGGAYTTDNQGVLSFVNEAATDGVTSFSLGESELATPYGEIAELYSSKESYPFVLFDADNKCIWGTSEFGNDADDGSALIKARWIFDNGGNAGTIYLRRDYNYKETALFSEISFVFGDLVIDLGGHRFETAKGTEYPLYANAKKGVDTNITVKNGSLVSGGKTILRYNVSGGPKNLRYTFDNVNFSVTESWTPQNYYASPFFCSLDWSGSVSSPVANGYLTLNNCNLDFTGADSSESMSVFDLATSHGNIKIDAVMNGGSIKADSFTKLSMYNLEDTASVSFGKSNGIYTKVIVPLDIPAPDDEVKNPDGQLLSYSASTDGTNTVYTMVYDEEAQPRPGYISSVKIYNFEDGNVGNAAKTGSPDLEVISSGNPDITLPEGFDNNALKLEYTNTGDRTYFNLTGNGNAVDSGIIEIKCDFLYHNDYTDGSATKNTNGVCLGISNASSERILWRILASSNDVLGDYSGWKTSDTALVEGNWYTIKAVVNMDNCTYDLYVKPVDDSDVFANYKIITSNLSLKDTAGKQIIPSQLYLKFHAESKLPQYLDNLKITVYEPVDMGAVLRNNSLNITFLKETELKANDKVYLACYFENELKELMEFDIPDTKTYKSLSELVYDVENEIKTEDYDLISIMVWRENEQLLPLVKKCKLG